MGAERLMGGDVTFFWGCVSVIFCFFLCRGEHIHDSHRDAPTGDTAPASPSKNCAKTGLCRPGIAFG